MKKERDLPVDVAKQYECGLKPVIVFKTDDNKEPVRLPMSILIGKDSVLAPGSLLDFVEADVQYSTEKTRKEIMSDSFKLNKDTNSIYTKKLKCLSELNLSRIDASIHLYIKNFLSLVLKDIYDKLLLNEKINFNKLRDNYQYLFSDILRLITLPKYPIITGTILNFGDCVEYMNYLNLSYDDIESSEELENYVHQTYASRILLDIFDKATTEIIGYINPEDISDNTIAFVLDVVTEVLVEWKNTLIEILLQIIKEFMDPVVYSNNKLLFNYEKTFYNGFDLKDSVSRILNSDIEDLEIDMAKLKQRNWNRIVNRNYFDGSDASEF